MPIWEQRQYKQIAVHLKRELEMSGEKNWWRSHHTQYESSGNKGHQKQTRLAQDIMLFLQNIRSSRQKNWCDKNSEEKQEYKQHPTQKVKFFKPKT